MEAPERPIECETRYQGNWCALFSATGAGLGGLSRPAAGKAASLGWR